MEGILWTATKIAAVITLLNIVWLIYLINKNFDLIVDALKQCVKRGKRYGKK